MKKLSKSKAKKCGNEVFKFSCEAVTLALLLRSNVRRYGLGRKPDGG